MGSEKIEEAIIKATDKVKLACSGTKLSALLARSEGALEREYHKALERPVKLPINEMNEAGGAQRRVGRKRQRSAAEEAAAARQKQLLVLRDDVRCLPVEVTKRVIIVNSVADLKLTEIWFVFDTKAHYVAFKANGRAMEAINGLMPRRLVAAVEGSFTDSILLDEDLEESASITFSSTLRGMALEFKSRCAGPVTIWNANR